MKILQKHFGELNEQTITAYTLVNDNGMEVMSLNYGCIITKIMTPDRHGKVENVVLGFDAIDDYLEHSFYFGAVVGRFAGRIRNAKFNLNNKTYRLVKNDNNNHLHGGLHGFDKVMWKTEIIEYKDSVSLDFTYLSKDGEEGYPGNLTMKVRYTLNNNNELIISYTGESDQSTPVNVTNHSYFNLSGNLKRDILNHQLNLKSRQFVELDKEHIPTGQFLAVENTPFNFQFGRKIMDGVSSDHTQNILAGNGYNHPFLLSDNKNQEIVLGDEESGRVLTIETDQPAVVLYTGTYLTDDFSIRGVQSRKYLGLCLESQGLPDAINHPHFPSAALEKGEVFRSETKYRFGVYGA
jgi:aldose 1-epimerase